MQLTKMFICCCYRV